MPKERRDVPIILLTGCSDAASSKQARTVGIRDFVMKPISRKDLAERIRKALAK